MEPSKIVEHESRAKADGPPRRQIMIDFLSVLFEGLPRTVKCTVVAQVVDAHFESV